MVVRSSVQNGALVVTPLVRRIDASVAPRLRAELLPIVKTSRCVVLVMDDVDAIDSTGLGTLVAILKAMPASAQLRLVGVNATVRKALELTRLLRIFVEHPSIEHALAVA